MFNLNDYNKIGYCDLSFEISNSNEVAIISVEVPGINMDEIGLEFIDQYLVVEGKKKNNIIGEKILKNSRSFGYFKKYINLPHNINKEAYKASVKNGILSIYLDVLK